MRMPGKGAFPHQLFSTVVSRRTYLRSGFLQEYIRYSLYWCHLLIPHSVGKCRDKEVPVRVCNPTDKYVTLKKGYHVGYLEEVDEIFKGEISYGADSPVDEQSAGLDSKASFGDVLLVKQMS